MSDPKDYVGCEHNTNHDGVPAGLRGLPRWVCWRIQWDRPVLPGFSLPPIFRKVPVNPRTLEPADLDDPGTWSDFPAAWAAARAAPGKLQGVGLVLGDGLVAVEIDGCRAACDWTDPAAAAAVRLLDSYTEVQESGTGLRVLVRATLPDGPRERRDSDRLLTYKVHGPGHFVVVTGRRLPESPAEAHDRPGPVAEFHREYIDDRAGRAAAALDGLPEELKELPRWATYRDAGGGRRELVHPHRDYIAGHADLAVVRDRVARGGVGAGLLLERRLGLTAVYLDDCRDPASGALADWADAAVRLLDSYTEVREAGTGVVVLARARVPGESRHRGSLRMCDDDLVPLRGGGTGAVGRRQEQLDALYAQYFGEPGPADGEDGPGPVLTDEEVVARAGRARNGEKFRRLWAGDTSGYPSASEAHVALANILAFWCRRDPDRVEALFGKSGMASAPKWKRKSYRDSVVGGACDDTTEEYSPRVALPGRPPPPAAPTAPADPLGPDDLKKAEAVAAGLAPGYAGLPDWDAAFRLARHLRKITRSDPGQFEAAALTFCRATGRDYSAFWLEFLDKWPRVRQAEGEDALGEAAKRAKDEYAATPAGKDGGAMDKDRWVTLVGGTARHLAGLAGGKVFAFPVERLAPACQLQQLLAPSADLGLGGVFGRFL